MKLRLMVLPATVLGVALALGVFQQAWTARFTRYVEPEVLTSRLARIPMRIGTWEGVDQTDTLPEGVPEIIGPTIVRRYVDHRTGAVVLLSITADRPGPLFVNHQPTTCYKGIGYDVVAGPVHRTVEFDGGSASFSTAVFTNAHGAAPRSLRIYWGFSGNGDWSTPRWPRITFARYPAVFKMYVINQLRRPNDPMESDPAEEFIRTVVPILKKTLFDSKAA